MNACSAELTLIVIVLIIAYIPICILLTFRARDAQSDRQSLALGSLVTIIWHVVLAYRMRASVE